ncbi:hypothetical protein CHU98_g8084 [Xylaria longipes]|nr:hypothetical protein CHU98_g8084 [Xylaria longipes]
MTSKPHLSSSIKATHHRTIDRLNQGLTSRQRTPTPNPDTYLRPRSLSPSLSQSWLHDVSPDPYPCPAVQYLDAITDQSIPGI